MSAQATRVPLSGGAYVARDVIASAQSCVNLFGEKNPPDSPVPMTYYPTPGLALFSTASGGVCRGLYVASGGVVYGVFGNTLVQFSSAGSPVTVGMLATGTPLATPVRMQDNGLVLVIVDGTAASGGTGGGWYVPINGIGASTGAPVAINDPAWQGSTTVAVLDTFLVFNAPSTAQFYLSPSNYIGNSTPFDPLYVAVKTAYPDLIFAVVSVAQLLWVIGQQVTEVWYDAGAADFPFARTPGVLIPYGTLSPYSTATIGGSVFFLGRDAHGRIQAMMGQQYTVERISTHAMEGLWQAYAMNSDAIGTTYQQDGHAFYVLSFPSAGATWAFDTTTGEWHQRMSYLADGVTRGAWLGAFVVNGSNYPVVGSTRSANIYTLQQMLGTENGAAIYRERTFTHMMSNGVRGVYRRFGIDLDTYGTTSATFNLAWSEDRGQTFPNSFPMTVDASAVDFPSLFRLGMARDRVFQVSWTDPNISALNGAFVWADAAAT